MVTPDGLDPSDFDKGLGQGIALVLAALILAWLVALTVAGIRALLL